jgi:hypothetical protein
VERGRLLVDVPPGVPQSEQQQLSGVQQQEEQFKFAPQPRHERAQVVMLDTAPAGAQQQYDPSCKSEVVVFPQEQVTHSPQQQYEQSVTKGMPAGQTFYAGNPAYAAQPQYVALPSAGGVAYQQPQQQYYQQQ